MKRKCLVWGFLLITLFLLTGCGSNSSSSKSDDDEKVRESSSDKSNNKEEQTKKETINISEVVCKFEDGLAAVKANDDYIYIIDEEGNVKFKIEQDLDVGSFAKDTIKIANSYVVIVKYDSENEKYISYMYDSDGKLVKSEENAIYSEVSKSGYFYVKRIEKSLAGETETMVIEELEGNVIQEAKLSDEQELFGGYYEYVVNDVFINRDVLVDLKTGKTQNFDSGTFYLGTEVIGDLIVCNNTAYPIDLSGSYSFSGKILSNDFYYDYNGIYDLKTGNLLKDLSDGGVSDIYYYDGVFYVYSETNYVYTMDTSFNYIKSPEERKSVKLLGVSSDGVVMQDYSSASVIGLIDKNFSVTKKFDTFGVPDEVVGDYLYFSTGSMFSIKLNRDL